MKSIFAPASELEIAIALWLLRVAMLLCAATMAALAMIIVMEIAGY